MVEPFILVLNWQFHPCCYANTIEVRYVPAFVFAIDDEVGDVPTSKVRRGCAFPSALSLPLVKAPILKALLGCK